VRVLDDPLALGFGRLGQATFVDEEGRLLLGSPDDPLCLFLRLLDDALALGIDPLGGADLFGDGDTELIDESEGGVLVDDNVRRERQLLAVGDQRLEALDEEDDVDRSSLPARWMVPGTRGRKYGTRTCRQRLGSASRRAVPAAAGTIDDTSPPNPAISLTRLELT